MKCPFRINKTIKLNLCDGRQKGTIVSEENFSDCYGDFCPCYYQDENGVDKCSRCEIQEEI